MAYTVTPTADADGNVTGFSTEHSHEGYHRSLDQEYVEFDDGSIHHRFENVEVNEDLQESEYTDDNYFQQLASLHPNVAQAIQWAADGGMSVEWSQDFNNALDNGDYMAVNQGLEQLLNMYDANHGDRPSASQEFEQNRAQDESEDDEPLTVDDLSEDDQQVVAEAVEELQYQTPGGEEQAEYWEQLVAQGQEAGDPTYAGIAAATAAFHAGEVSAAEAIQYVLSNYDIRDVARVYQAFTS
jgi:hypothetical protein